MLTFSNSSSFTGPYGSSSSYGSTKPVVLLSGSGGAGTEMGGTTASGDAGAAAPSEAGINVGGASAGAAGEGEGASTGTAAASGDGATAVALFVFESGTTAASSA